MKNLKGKKALVVGLGKSGLAAAQLLASKGAIVSVTDERPPQKLKDYVRQLPKGVRLEAGGHRALFEAHDLIVVSPGVPWNSPGLKAARQKGTSVWSELELGWRFVDPYRTVAVTGTNGKTTTTSMIGAILNSAKLPVVIGGNIGTPLSALVKWITKKTYLVLEVSSYQLEGQDTFHPNVAVYLNITPDHLARHGTIKKYAEAKGRMLVHFKPSDTVVYNKNDRWCRALVKKVRCRKIFFPNQDLTRLASHTPLRGQHNLENAMAATGAALALGLEPDEISTGIRSFKGVRHRTQIVATRRGVVYVNDSKATNVDSTLVALKSFSEPIILLLGGEHKGSSYRPLIPIARLRVREVIAFGEAQKIIEKDLGRDLTVQRVANLKQAIKRASRIAQPGNVVLLSPACASFDQYDNYEQRGDHFMTLVRELPR